MKTNINTNPEFSGDRINYRSPDGAVTIVTKVSTAKRWPKHNYPVVCMQLRPSPGTRVQKLEDGSGGLDVLFSHLEVEKHVEALNEADPKAAYRVPHIPEKPRHRKAKWDEINHKRRGKRDQE